MSRRLIVLAVVLLAGLGLVVYAFSPGEEPKADVIPESDVTFATPRGETLKLDLARPGTGQGPFPAVVCLHGGGWIGGTKRQMAQTIHVLARRGYVAIAPDYRVAPRHRFPACVEDCKAAVRWLRVRAKQYNIDPDRIGVVGLAAGGHLACLLGVTQPSDGMEGVDHAGVSSSVRAVVSFSGPTDLTSADLSKEALTNNLKPLLGGSPREKPAEYRKASPLLYTPKSPPAFLLIHGAKDREVPLAQAHGLADKVLGAGGYAKVSVLEGEGHTYSGVNLLRSIDQMLSFLDEKLKK